MPQASSVVLNDGTVNHTFVPVAVSPEKSVFVDRSAATGAGSPSLVLGFDGSKPARLTNKISIRLNQPLEYTVDGVVLIKSTIRFQGEYVLPDGLTSAERIAFNNMVQAAVSVAGIAGYVDSLEPYWG